MFSKLTGTVRTDFEQVGVLALVGVALVLAVGVAGILVAGSGDTGQLSPTEAVDVTGASVIESGTAGFTTVDGASPALGGNAATAGVPAGQVGSGTAAAGTDNGVSTQSSFNVSIIETTAPVEGESLTVTVELTNTGQAGEQVVTARAGPLGETSETVSLSSGASTERTLSIDTSAGDATTPGDAADSPYTLTVTSATDVATTAAEVVLPAGGNAGSPPQDLSGNDKYEDIDGEGSFDIFDVQALFNRYDDPALGDHIWAFDFNGDEILNIFDVQALFATLSNGGVDERAAFDVRITGVDSEVSAGEMATVDYEVENAGDRADTQDIAFTVGGSVEGTETDVTLGGGETFTGQFSYEPGADDTPGVGVGVSSDTDLATAAVSVSASASFAVNITDVDETVAAGETLTVDYEVENTSGVEATQDIEFAVDGTVEETNADLTLGGGETFAGQFSYETVEADVPGIDLSVSSANDSATASVSVLTPAEFTVDIPETTTPVEGEQLDVTATVENVGESEGTQSVTLDVGALGSNSTDVTLAGGQTTNVTLSVGTGAGDAGEYTATVSSADDSATESVTVLAPAAFDVSITAPEEVAAGTELAVDYTVENTGDIEATQDIEFAVNGTVEGTETDVTLGGGETFTNTFVYGTAESDVPAVTVSVSSDDDSGSAAVTVSEADIFAVEITSAEDEVLRGETVTVDYTVENTGETPDTQDIEFTVDGAVEDTEPDVTLGGGETFSGQFSYETGSADVPGIDITVASDNDTAERTVTVNEPALFAVNITATSGPVLAGETLTVDYEVENTGGAEATQDIEFLVDGSVEDTETDVILDGGEMFAGQFSYDTGSGDVPGVDVSVASANDTATETVTVSDPPFFDVTVTDIDDAVTEGETVTVAYEVTNTGGVETTQDITLAVNGTTEDTETDVTLGSGETVSDQFSYDTGTGDAPALDVSVASDDDTATETVAVNEPAFFEVTITDIDDPVTEGETVTVTYEVTNTGDLTATQDIEFTVNGTAEGTNADVTLDSGETVSDQFSYDTVAGDAPGIEVAVASANDTATESVTVNAPTVFEVTVTDITDAVTEGETVTVEYSVENTGGVEGTQDITFAVNGTTEDTETGVTLGGGEMFSGQFSYDTGTGDSPAVSVTVESEDDAATETVTVLEPAAFAVSITSIDDPVTEGETVTVDYEVENTGGAEATQDIEFLVDGSVEDTETDVTLGGGESFSGQFSYGTGTGDAPAIDASVSSADDTVTETVTVNEPAAFDVTVTDIDDPVTEGETVTVNYTVENTGDIQDTQDIAFTVNGTTEDTETGVTLGGGEMFSGQFSYETAAGDSPAVAVSVASDDDTTTETVAVLAPAVFEVSITDIDDGVSEGETLTANYTVENTGDVQDTQDITVTVNGSVENTRSDVTLDGGESFDGTFTYETGVGDSPAVTVTVATADTADSADVEVLENNPDIVASLSQEQGSVGDIVGVDLDVTTFGGSGDGFGSYQLGLSFDDSVLSFEGIVAGGWGDPSSQSSTDGKIAVSDFAPSGQTPVEPALTFEFEIVAQGSATVAFDDGVIENVINDPGGNEYLTKYEDGAAGTSASAVAGAYAVTAHQQPIPAY
jgi:hypothetical protein